MSLTAEAFEQRRWERYPQKRLLLVGRPLADEWVPASSISYTYDERLSDVLHVYKALLSHRRLITDHLAESGLQNGLGNEIQSHAHLMREVGDWFYSSANSVDEFLRAQVKC
jgi:hypothetical protein